MSGHEENGASRAGTPVSSVSSATKRSQAVVVEKRTTEDEDSRDELTLNAFRSPEVHGDGFEAAPPEERKVSRASCFA